MRVKHSHSIFDVFKDTAEYEGVDVTEARGKELL